MCSNAWKTSVTHKKPLKWQIRVEIFVKQLCLTTTPATVWQGDGGWVPFLLWAGISMSEGGEWHFKGCRPDKLMPYHCRKALVIVLMRTNCPEIWSRLALLGAWRLSSELVTHLKELSVRKFTWASDRSHDWGSITISILSLRKLSYKEFIKHLWGCLSRKSHAVRALHVQVHEQHQSQISGWS